MTANGTPEDPDDDGLDREAIDAAMQQVPNGATALAGLTVSSRAA